MHVLVTGAAGFIGFHLCQRLLNDGAQVTGIDNINNYYDPQLKKDRLALLSPSHSFSFHAYDLADSKEMEKLFAENDFTHVVNLAAQAGVRYSLINPSAYIQSNIVGFGHILEGCRHGKVKHLVYASSSSVYGLNKSVPFSTADNVDHPVSLYAASKKSNELMAHSYSHLYNIPTTGLRFFTVYGPWGRPDMALYIFTKNILEGKAIPVFNNGKLMRDFTYIDDIIEGTMQTLRTIPTPNPSWNSLNPDPSTSPAPYSIYNIGNNKSVPLSAFIEQIEKALGRKAIIEYLPMQPGDVEATYANIDALQNMTGFNPSTPLDRGIQNFVDWFKKYYNY